MDVWHVEVFNGVLTHHIIFRFHPGPRTLCNACGLSKCEQQYRQDYVYMPTYYFHDALPAVYLDLIWCSFLFLISSACTVWGKLSRSKAALAAKNKQEADIKTETEKPGTVDLQPATTAGTETPKRPVIDPITLTDIARKKRGRGRSTTRDEGEDMGSVTILNDNEALTSVSAQNEGSSHLLHDNGNEQAGTQGQTKDVAMSGGDSTPPPQPSFRSPADEPDNSQEGGCQVDPLMTAMGPAPSSQSPDTLPFSTHENYAKEVSVAGRKLNLSYLLAWYTFVFTCICLLIKSIKQKTFPKKKHESYGHLAVIQYCGEDIFGELQNMEQRSRVIWE